MYSQVALADHRTAEASCFGPAILEQWKNWKYSRCQNGTETSTDVFLKPLPTSPTASDWPNSSTRSLCIRGLRWSSGSANLARDATMCWECRFEVLWHSMYTFRKQPEKHLSMSAITRSAGPQPHRPLHHFGSWWIQAGAQFCKVQRPNLILRTWNWGSSDRSSC